MENTKHHDNVESSETPSWSLDKKSGVASTPVEEVENVANAQYVEVVKTMSRLAGNARCIEKNETRTYPDGQDHSHDPRVSLQTVCLIAKLIIICS
jgi:hypothetical protein